jgi:hypothetical protein
VSTHVRLQVLPGTAPCVVATVRGGWSSSCPARTGSLWAQALEARLMASPLNVTVELHFFR